MGVSLPVLCVNHLMKATMVPCSIFLLKSSKWLKSLKNSEKRHFNRLRIKNSVKADEICVIF